MTIYLPGPESAHSLAYNIREFTLYVMVSGDGDGIVAPEVGEHKYMEGEVVRLVASPNEGSIFIEWKGSEVEDKYSATTQITMTFHTSKTVIAVFEKQATLTIMSSGGGTTIPAPSVTNYRLNRTVDLKAIPNDGFEFNGWVGDITSPNDTYSLVMDKDKTVAASFIEKTIPQISNEKLYLATAKMKAFWKVDGLWRFFATSVHKYLDDLLSDDHPQYLNENRHDVVDRHELGTVVPHDTAEGVGALTKLSGSALPTAGEEYRGQFFMLEGSGDPATDDTIYCCISVDGGTTFTWKPLS